MGNVKTWQKVVIGILAAVLLVVITVAVMNEKNSESSSAATREQMEYTEEVETTENESDEYVAEQVREATNEIKKAINQNYDGETYIPEKPQRANVYYDPNNFPTGTGINISPAYIYYENGEMHAVCYVKNLNQRYERITNIRELSFSNSKGVFAKKSFDDLNGCTLGPGQCGTYDFVFPKGSFKEADLTGHIKWYSAVLSES